MPTPMTSMCPKSFPGGSNRSKLDGRNRPGSAVTSNVEAVVVALLTYILSVTPAGPPVNEVGGSDMNYSDVKRLVDIADVLNFHGFDGDTVAAGGKILCPLPWHDATVPGFALVPGSLGEVWHCLGSDCGSSGDIFQLHAARTGAWDGETAWADLPKATLRQVLLEVAGIAGCAVGGDEFVDVAIDVESMERRRRLEQVNNLVADVCHDYLLERGQSAPDRKAAWRRIEKYGFSEEAVKGVRLGVCPLLKKGAVARPKLTFGDDRVSLKTGFQPEDLYDWRLRFNELKISEEDAMGSGLFIKHFLAPDRAEDTDPYLLVCVMGGRLTFPYVGPNHETQYLIGRVLDGEVPIVPYSGYKGPPKDMASFVKVLKKAKSPKRQVALYLREHYSKFHKPFAHTTNEFVYPEAVEPLMATPPHPGEDALRSGWEPTGDLIIAEGAPDLISCYQLGLQAVSPVTTRVSNANRPALERLGRKCKARGKRLIWVPDNEENSAGMKGAISTATKLHVKALPVRIATLPREGGKTDLNEFARERDHEPGILDDLLGDAQPPDTVLLKMLVPELTGTLLEALSTPVLPKWKSVLEVTNAAHWNRYLKLEVAQRFEGLDEKSPQLREVEEYLLAQDKERELKAALNKYSPEKRVLLKNISTLEHNDMGNARAFAAMYGDRVRFCRRRGQFFVWNRHYWKRTQGAEVDRFMVSAVEARQRAAHIFPAEKHQKQLLAFLAGSKNDAKLKAAISQVKRLEQVEWGGDVELDPEPMVLGCENGVVDLRTGELRPGKREDLMTRTTGIGYDPKACCPRFEKFLSEVFADGNLIDYVQRAAGYSLTGLTSEQVAFLCLGTGCNGKSVLLEALRGALGDYAGATPFTTFESAGYEGIGNDLAALAGTRFVSVSESSRSRFLNEAKFKRATGGDPLTVRFLHQEYFTYFPEYKLWFATNDLPQIRGTDEGVWRRIHVIPFSVSFLGREDRGLTAELMQEAPGILRWAVEGAMRWQKKGLAPPKSVCDESLAYREDNDDVARFLEERVVADKKGRIAASALYSAFKAWCRDNGIDEVMTKTAFGRMLRSKELKKHKTNKAFHYLGISFSERSDPRV